MTHLYASEHDVANTSVLKRAIRTLWTVLDEMELMWIPVYRSWRLNESHYGALQGLNKAETAEKFGEDQVKIWRRSYDIPPPELTPADERYPGRDPRYRNLSQAELPLTECLKDTVARFLPLWHETIAPDIQGGKRVLIAAHGNSLRALVKYLDHVSEQAIVELNIPTGMPLVYGLDDHLKPLNRYYLGDPAKVKAAMEAVAATATRSLTAQPSSRREHDSTASTPRDLLHPSTGREAVRPGPARIEGRM